MKTITRYVLIKCPSCKHWGATVTFRLARYFATCDDCGHEWITQAYTRMANVDWNNRESVKAHLRGERG